MVYNVTLHAHHHHHLETCIELAVETVDDDPLLDVTPPFSHITHAQLFLLAIMTRFTSQTIHTHAHTHEHCFFKLDE